MDGRWGRRTSFFFFATEICAFANFTGNIWPSDRMPLEGAAWWHLDFLSFMIYLPLDTGSTRSSPREKQGTPRVTCTQLRAPGVQTESGCKACGQGWAGVLLEWTDGQSKIKWSWYFYWWDLQILIAFGRDAPTPHLSIPEQSGTKSLHCGVTCQFWTPTPIFM